MRMVWDRDFAGWGYFGNWEKLLTRGAQGRAKKIKVKGSGQECPLYISRSTLATPQSLFQDAVVQLFTAPVGGGLDEGQHNGMRGFFGGG